MGLVPTMGNLHAGHLSLITQAKQENALCMVSIFVNPTQFNDNNDFDHYPRTLEEDIALCQSVGVDYIFIPEKAQMYPDDYAYKITEQVCSKLLEGKFRPSHFEGVLTIVMKLFCLLKPTRAYFGEKDFQQLTLIKGLVNAFFLDTKIVACPTIRNDQGLALSSRNNRLSPSDLKKSEELCLQLKSSQNENQIKENLEKSGFEVDYIEKWNGRLLAAVTINGVRLIDNVSF